MSDGFTDVARDDRRNELYVEYIEKFADFVENPARETSDAVLKIAKEMDAIPRGYWQSSTNIANQLEGHLHDLTNVFLEIKKRK